MSIHVKALKGLDSFVSTPSDLIGQLNLPQSLLSSANAGDELFSLLVPQSYLSLIEKGNPRDPLLLQILPSREESRSHQGFIKDPVGDKKASLSKALLKKYRGRALLITTRHCAVNCRFCFRRHRAGEKGVTSEDLDEALELIGRDSSLSEVILSGGDPLTLPLKSLEKILRRLEEIPHIKRYRIHSRLPTVAPEKMTSPLFEALSSSLQGYLVFHINHPGEISSQFIKVVEEARKRSLVLLSQSVLLKRINDSVAVLEKLFFSLADLGVLPYYLHHLDRVQGAGHFWVEEERGVEIMDELRRLLPGYALPAYVKEVSGDCSKRPIP